MEKYAFLDLGRRIHGDVSVNCVCWTVHSTLPEEKGKDNDDVQLLIVVMMWMTPQTNKQESKQKLAMKLKREEFTTLFDFLDDVEWNEFYVIVSGWPIFNSS